ncbi:MAG: PQQ-dependent sugar dehydrogenase [Akkermansiaceae bacterium]
MKKLTSILTSLIIGQLAVNADSLPRAVKIIDNLAEPVFLTAPKATTDALYILEKAGRVMVYDRKTKKLLPKPFLDIRSQIDIKMNEQGLLGMAFSPTYKKDRRFYLYYTDTEGDTQVSRFTVAQDEAEITEEKLISVPQDFRNHNGGWIGFGPDKNLYIALGDGGSGNDPKERAQDMSKLLGKLLRIDVSSETGYLIPDDNPFISAPSNRHEIYAYGLRNPWRCSWDIKTNSLYIADVGQNHWEEINAVTYEDLRGANFGWRTREATHATAKDSVGGEKPDAAIDPIYEYDHSVGKSITGGYVYRGKIKSIYGHYFFADWVKPKIWSIAYDGEKITAEHNWTNYFAQRGRPVTHMSSFGVDPQGELYIISHKGDIFAIVE